MSQAAKLLNSASTRIRVLRANEEVELDRKEVVPSDVLIFASSYSLLTVSQASLTGGLMRAEKDIQLLHNSDIIDNEKICLAGTSPVTTGSGRFMVILTGESYYFLSSPLILTSPATVLEQSWFPGA